MWHLSKGVQSHEQLRRVKHCTLCFPENLAIKIDQAWEKEHFLNPDPIMRYALTKMQQKTFYNFFFPGKVF